MNKAACVVADETYKGFRTLAGALLDGTVIVSVPSAAAADCCTVLFGVAAGCAGKALEPACAQPASTAAVKMDSTSVRGCIVSFR
jgi:hypothetical protein